MCNKRFTKLDVGELFLKDLNVKCRDRRELFL